MDSPRQKHENNSLYLLAFVIAICFRFIQLGALPLTDPEAEWALQALRVAQGAKPLLGPQPAYILLTSILFFIFGSANFLARFWPALTGSALVFVPYFFRNRIKQQPALILAFALAIDPGMVAASRQAGGTMLAVAFTLLAWAMWQDERPQWAGFFGGIALLSGTPLWIGLLGLGLAWAIRQGMEKPRLTEKAGGKESSSLLSRVDPEKLKTSFAYGIGTLLLGGTLFFLSPNGLSAWLASLPVFIKGWWTPSGTTGGQMLLALLIYQPLAVGLGLFSLVRGWEKGSRNAIRLSLWLLTSLLLALSYPAHQVTDLVWPLLPLWALAAIELARHVDLPVDGLKETAGVFALTLTILVFVWLDLASLASLPLPSQQGTIRLLLLGGSLMLLIVSIVLVALGWSHQVAKAGGLWGTVIVLAIYTLGVAWGATGLRTPDGYELWASGARPTQADLLRQSVNDLSDWSRGHVDAQPVTIVGVDSPALRWLLRYHEVEIIDMLNLTETPPLVITSQVADLGLTATYRGQDFLWRQSPVWERFEPANWLKWLVFRQLPQDSETIILWARDDLFLNGKNKIMP